MRLRTKIMLAAAGVFSYLVIKEAIELEDRYEELQEYEAEVNDKIIKANHGIDSDKIIDVDFTRVQ